MMTRTTCIFVLVQFLSKAESKNLLITADIKTYYEDHNSARHSIQEDNLKKWKLIDSWKNIEHQVVREPLTKKQKIINIDGIMSRQPRLFWPKKILHFKAKNELNGNKINPNKINGNTSINSANTETLSNPKKKSLKLISMYSPPSPDMLPQLFKLPSLNYKARADRYLRSFKQNPDSVSQENNPQTLLSNKAENFKQSNISQLWSSSLRDNMYKPEEAEQYWLDNYLEDPHCMFHSKWTINCYDCNCNSGKPSCRFKSGCKAPSNNAPNLCRPYSVFFLDDNGCSQCKCNGDGYPECTISRCSSAHHLPLPGSENLQNECRKARVCRKGTSWISNCYQCQCDQDGQPKCKNVEYKCTPRPYGVPATCKPYTTIDMPNVNVCQTCKCSDEGETKCVKTC